ncbi:MAG: glycoside hydrolase family 3 C-terminal domain-containing protein [Paludibacter sp.]|nr:glycoside hydrolase family 3 C-terminal domain-containing protein [Paludibacter sp.]
MKKLILAISLLLFSFILSAQKVSSDAENRAKSLVEQMTLKEKIDYISGYNDFFIRAIPRLGIPEIRMADGPQGVRNNTKSTLYPCGIATTSTWNRGLMHKVGEGLGLDCRARGVNILLGPGVNIYRSPLCGRNFEYFGEDPYLASETAVQYIKGVQSQNVIATIKHFAGNNEEYDRHDVSSDIDKRTLHEVYLATFRKAVEQANVGAVMNSYNLVNGVHSSENEYLNIAVLRKMWGFKGILMSDWVSVYSTVGAANGGLDLEMPDGQYMNYENLSKAIEYGLVSVKTIDEKVQHILQTIISFGIFDNPKKDASIPERNPYTENIALQIAREGIVLLKNDANVLPLKGKTIFLGPNTNEIPTGGGSGFVDPFSSVSLYKALQEKSNHKNFEFILDPVPDTNLMRDGEFFTEKDCKIPGFKAEYFKNEKLSGTPDFIGVDQSINFDWQQGAALAGFPNDNFSVRWSAIFKPKVTGEYKLKLSADDGYRMFFDGKLALTDWNMHPLSGKDVNVRVEAGKEYPVVIEYFEGSGDAVVNFAYTGLKDVNSNDKIKNAENVVICAGFNSSLEGEGFDRPFELPKEQTELIDKVSKLNKNVVVIINAGGGVEMASWKDKVKGIIMAWYPGQQGGQALAEIITGKISPSGKLPISIEKRLEDNPTFNNYVDSRPDVTHKRVQYNEGVFLGYKGYEKSGIEPLYPFGFGLSYTDFEYSGLKIQKLDGNHVTVSFTVKNTGKFDGAEVCQVYVGDVISSVPRPKKELKGFDKVFLKKGESRIINIDLNEDAFSFFDVNTNKFVVEPGEFTISVGSSVRDIHLTGNVIL